MSTSATARYRAAPSTPFKLGPGMDLSIAGGILAPEWTSGDPIAGLRHVLGECMAISRSDIQSALPRSREQPTVSHRTSSSLWPQSRKRPSSSRCALSSSGSRSSHPAASSMCPLWALALPTASASKGGEMGGTTRTNGPLRRGRRARTTLSCVDMCAQDGAAPVCWWPGNTGSLGRRQETLKLAGRFLAGVAARGAQAATSLRWLFGLLTVRLSVAGAVIS